MSGENEVPMSTIKKNIKIYKKLLKDLLKKCQVAKCRLETWHCLLYKVNSAIQLTVIYFSSTFLQALLPNDTNQSSDSLLNNTSVEDAENEEYITIVGTTTLAITSYSSLIIALARHFKIEERVGNVSNLIDRFAEIVSRIRYDLGTLKPWDDDEYCKNINNIVSILALISIFIATINIVGGFMVTKRMLAMFQRS